MSDVEYIKSFFKIHPDFPKKVHSVDLPVLLPTETFPGSKIL